MNTSNQFEPPSDRQVQGGAPSTDGAGGTVPCACAGKDIRIGGRAHSCAPSAPSQAEALVLMREWPTAAHADRELLLADVEPAAHCPADPDIAEHEAACRRAHDASLRRIRAQVGVVLRRSLDAEDVLQDAWIVLLSDSSRSMDGGDGNLRRRLFAIAELCLRTAARRASARRNDVGEDSDLTQTSDGDTTTSQIEDEEGANGLRQAIQRLSERQKRILELRYWHDLGFEEVATALGLPTSDAAYTLHRRALEALRRALLTPRQATGAPLDRLVTNSPPRSARPKRHPPTPGPPLAT